jgi:excisionase family DNA binding protein
MQSDPFTKSDFLSIGKSSEYLGVSIDTLRRWEEKGKLITYRSPGGHRYFKKNELDQLFNTKYERVAPEKQPLDEVPSLPKVGNFYSNLSEYIPSQTEKSEEIKPQSLDEVKNAEAQSATPMQELPKNLESVLTTQVSKNPKSGKDTALIVIISLIVVFELVLLYFQLSSTKIVSPIP